MHIHPGHTVAAVFVNNIWYNIDPGTFKCHTTDDGSEYEFIYRRHGQRKRMRVSADLVRSVQHHEPDHRPEGLLTLQQTARTIRDSQ